MKTFGRLKHKGKPYIIAGFGRITAKKYPIKKNTKGEYIVFNMKRTYLKRRK